MKGRPKVADAELPIKVAQKVREAAEALMLRAPELTDNSPILAIGALLLAAGSAAALAKVPYEEMVALISGYYEAILLTEVEAELAGHGRGYVLPFRKGVRGESN